MCKNNSVPGHDDWAHSVTTFFLPITLMKSLFYPQREQLLVGLNGNEYVFFAQAAFFKYQLYKEYQRGHHDYRAYVDGTFCSQQHRQYTG